MKIQLKTVRRAVGFAALAVFALAFVGCHATNETGFDFQAASFRITLVMNAVDVQLEPSASPAGWTIIRNTASKFNGLSYWRPVFSASRVILPFFPIGVGALLIAIACVLPDYLRVFKEADRRWANQCVVCGYSLKCNTSGKCPECGRIILASDRHPWKPPSPHDRLSS